MIKQLQATAILLTTLAVVSPATETSDGDGAWRRTRTAVAGPAQSVTRMRMPRVREDRRLSVDRVELKISAVEPESVYSCELRGTSRGRVVRIELPVDAHDGDGAATQSLLLDPGSTPTIRCLRDVSLGYVQLEATVSGKLLAVGR